ncbi:polysaccharide deacetylase [Bosea sp. (in: a-proteobacteria)]|uniref:polysaccharide deacetylase family protein n=1 Tax=Bosea sp. (in: a-proteobacteria) TaxID=1871050 RepID=UPI0026140DD9|nr:polysaccharide deacetylase [Bosea sp. (in: a-proteobacteria)]MCO5093159.1 polysaccharide deacetylase [Bosea sp. (in: a-proteobacteria)]
MHTQQPWPNGARIAVLLAIHFDAETLWTSRDPANWERPGTLSMGTYGGKVGVPNVLSVLQEYKLKSTFFVPGWTAEKYVDRMEAILAAGHEVAHHGYSHQWIDPKFPEREREELERGLSVLKSRYGVKPSGYASPAGETSPNMMELLQEHGFTYDATLMDQIDPYRTVLKDGSLGPVELPWHWNIDDACYSLFSRAQPRPIFPNSQIFEIWSEEFTEIYSKGGFFHLVLHPQVIGRPVRIALLRRMLEFILSHQGVWVATGDEIARTWLQANPERREPYQIG